MNKCVDAYPEIAAIEQLYILDMEMQKVQKLRTTFIHRENSININKLSATSGCEQTHGFIFHFVNSNIY